MSDPTINQVRTQAEKDGNLLKKGGGLMDAWQSRRCAICPIVPHQRRPDPLAPLRQCLSQRCRMITTPFSREASTRSHLPSSFSLLTARPANIAHTERIALASFDHTASMLTAFLASSSSARISITFMCVLLRLTCARALCVRYLICSCVLLLLPLSGPLCMRMCVPIDHFVLTLRPGHGV